jgi:hypothetical protein
MPTDVEQLGLIHPEVSRETLEFLHWVSKGRGPLNAALAVGWSPRFLTDQMKVQDFVELYDEARLRLIESVEEQAYAAALRGNITAIQLVLYCQANDKGWRPPTQRLSVTQQSQVRVELVEATKAAAVELMRSHGVEALQIGGPLDDLDDEEIVDAELVDEQ